MVAEIQGASGRLVVEAGDSTAHVRMDAMNQETIDHYFSLLKDTLSTHALLDKPSQIYKFDESGVTLNPRPPKVMTTRGRVTKKQKGLAKQVPRLIDYNDEFTNSRRAGD